METELNRAATAARAGDTEALTDILRGSPGVIEARDAGGDSLLGLACRAATGDIAIPPDPGTPGQHAAVDLILAGGADPDVSMADGWRPLHTAAMAGHLDLARRLLAAGATREGQLHSAEGGSPLALALFYAKTDMGELLAEPAVPDNLRHAAALGRPLERFMEGGALTAQAMAGLDFYGPLVYFPSWSRSLDRQEVLNEALTWASRNGQLESMAELLELGADVNANPYRGTALLWAIYSDCVEAACWLLDHGADPNLRHDFGGEGHGVAACAIHLAAQFNAVRSVELLLQRDADPDIVDGAHGGNALDWATFSEAEDAAQLLRQWRS